MFFLTVLGAIVVAVFIAAGAKTILDYFAKSNAKKGRK